MGEAELTIPLAHSGHWLPYVIPVVIVLVAVTVAAIRERRARDAGDEGH
jgi:hypothetical protein